MPVKDHHHSRTSTKLHFQAVFSTVAICLSLSLVTGVMIASAIDEPTLPDYQVPTIPSRDSLIRSVRPTTLPDPNSARIPGMPSLQSLNSDTSDTDTIRQTMRTITSERAQPSSGTASDPLATDASTGQNAQSSLTRNGSLPAGAVDAAPQSFNAGALVTGRIAQDATSSFENSLAAFIALRAEISNKQTEKIAGKLDQLNDSHRSINNKMKDLAKTMNDVLKQLPTIPAL